MSTCEAFDAFVNGSIDCCKTVLLDLQRIEADFAKLKTLKVVGESRGKALNFFGIEERAEGRSLVK